VPEPVGHRTLGKLEVSAVGLGVQNMSRRYEPTLPHRPEMINIIRAAFDRGVTFYDAAEAYGPHEVERILGEGILKRLRTDRIDLRDLETAASKIEVQRARYSEAAQRMINH
jgi:aryl-alcohol dehydrogenase-like predicted oxidoreductase